MARLCVYLSIILAFAAAGCKCGCGNKIILSDPLLVSRKPVEVDAVTSPPLMVAATEPVIPPHPFGPAFAVKQNLPATLTSAPHEVNQR